MIRISTFSSAIISASFFRAATSLAKVDISFGCLKNELLNQIILLSANVENWQKMTCALNTVFHKLSYIYLKHVLSLSESGAVCLDREPGGFI